jgi:hypothetical protein
MRGLGQGAQGMAPEAVEDGGRSAALERGPLEEERVRERRPAVGDGHRAVHHEREDGRHHGDDGRAPAAVEPEKDARGRDQE